MGGNDNLGGPLEADVGGGSILSPEHQSRLPGQAVVLGVFDTSLILFLALLAAVLASTVFYAQVCAVSEWSADHFFLIEPCLLIAILSSVAGVFGYWIRRAYVRVTIAKQPNQTIEQETTDSD